MCRAAFQASLGIVLFSVLTSMVVAQSNVGSIDVRTNVAGAKVWVDGNYAGKTDLRFGMNILSIPNLRVGNHTIRCEAIGFNPFVDTVTVKSETTIPLNVVFSTPTVRSTGERATTGTQMAQTGNLRVHSTPTGASVYLDGVSMPNPTDSTLSDVAVGKHTIRVRLGTSELHADVQILSQKTITALADFYNGKITTDAEYTLNINSTPSGTVFVDGRSLGQSPRSVNLRNGRHEITIRAAGYVDYNKVVDLQDNSLENIRLEAIHYTLTVGGSPSGAAVYLIGNDGNKKKLGSLPLTADITPGRHEVRVDANGFGGESRTFVVDDNQPNPSLNFALPALSARLDIDGAGQFPYRVFYFANDELLGEPPLSNVRIPAESVDFSVTVDNRITELFKAYNIIPNHRYRLTYLPLLPLVSTHVDVTQLTGYEPIPKEPKYLPLSKSVRRTFSPGAAGLGLFLGGVSGVIVALLAYMPSGELTTNPNLGLGIVGAGAGGMALLLGFIAEDYKTVDLPENQATNELLRAKWLRQKQDVTNNNEMLRKREVQRIDAENAKFVEENKTRGKSDLVDLGEIQN